MQRDPVDENYHDPGPRCFGNCTLTITAKADGPTVHVTLTLISKAGKTIAERKILAPGEAVFSEKFKEPVAHIRFSAPSKSMLVSYFPNPSNGQFKVTLDKSVKLPALLSIFNDQGTKVHSQLLFSASTDVTLADAKPGLYVSRMASNEGVVTKVIQVDSMML